MHGKNYGKLRPSVPNTRQLVTDGGCKQNQGLICGVIGVCQARDLGVVVLPVSPDTVTCTAICRCFFFEFLTLQVSLSVLGRTQRYADAFFGGGIQTKMSWRSPLTSQYSR